MPSLYRHLTVGKFIASSGLILFSSVSLRAEPFSENNNSISKLEVNHPPIEYQLKNELITWLGLNSQISKSELSKNLNLNRNLGKKLCGKPIKFSFTTSSKRMIKAECINSWRRYIKKPSWVRVENTVPEQKKPESKTIVNTFILKKDVQKNEEITLNDLTRKKIGVKKNDKFLQEHNAVMPMISRRTLKSGEAVLLKDVAIGREILIAKTTIPSSSSLTKDVVRLDTIFFDIPDDALTKIEGWEFMELNRNIIAGEILRQRHLRKAKLVRRNDPIIIIIRNSSLEILTSGTSLQDGYYGQRIKVINLESGRSVLGTVTGRGEVEVDTK